ncbi:hypothetical protein EVAR_90623_1 [Eumeta japonica]|uniref:Uncharacterized protein n=1 Tax=Eumeta variegata TaxID=151549 RepID=A0A4C1ZV49_EUMVA|nr:hypothetical protein EVAR_90623_1 [Eumeta japonica]
MQDLKTRVLRAGTKDRERALRRACACACAYTDDDTILNRLKTKLFSVRRNRRREELVVWKISCPSVAPPSERVSLGLGAPRLHFDAPFEILNLRNRDDPYIQKLGPERAISFNSRTLIQTHKQLKIRKFKCIYYLLECTTSQLLKTAKETDTLVNLAGRRACQGSTPTHPGRKATHFTGKPPSLFRVRVTAKSYCYYREAIRIIFALIRLHDGDATRRPRLGWRRNGPPLTAKLASLGDRFDVS